MNIIWAKEQIEYSIKNSTNEKNLIFIITYEMKNILFMHLMIGEKNYY